MPRTCTICSHTQRPAIDRALVAGESFRYVAKQYATSATALFRHKAEHIPATLAKAQSDRESSQAGDLLGQVEELRATASRILQKAERAGDLRTALLGVREARACLELLAEMEGELNRNPVINILINPQWIHLRAVILQALAPYPEARGALSEVISRE